MSPKISVHKVKKFLNNKTLLLKTIHNIIAIFEKYSVISVT